MFSVMPILILLRMTNVLHCDMYMYNDIIEQLFEKCFNAEPDFKDFSDDEKLGFIFNSEF